MTPTAPSAVSYTSSVLPARRPTWAPGRRSSVAVTGVTGTWIASRWRGSVMTLPEPQVLVCHGGRLPGVASSLRAGAAGGQGSTPPRCGPGRAGVKCPQIGGEP